MVNSTILFTPAPVHKQNPEEIVEIRGVEEMKEWLFEKPQCSLGFYLSNLVGALFKTSVILSCGGDFRPSIAISFPRQHFVEIFQKVWLVVSNIFYFHPYLGKIPILTNIFQRGWNHQLEVDGPQLWMRQKRLNVTCLFLEQGGCPPWN